MPEYKKYNGWYFAYVNGNLSEIFFAENRKIIGHCEVDKSDYTTKQEKEWIEKDTREFDFIYNNGVYRNKVDEKEFLRVNPSYFNQKGVHISLEDISEY